MTCGCVSGRDVTCGYVSGRGQLIDTAYEIGAREPNYCSEVRVPAVNYALPGTAGGAHAATSLRMLVCAARYCLSRTVLLGHAVLTERAWCSGHGAPAGHAVLT